MQNSDSFFSSSLLLDLPMELRKLQWGQEIPGISFKYADP